MVDGDVSAEVLSTDLNGMIEEGKKLAQLFILDTKCL